MKKIIFLLLLFVSCEKDIIDDPTYCWTCKVNILNPNSSSSVTLNMCDMSDDDINTFENDNDFDNGIFTITVTCNKKE